MRKNKALYFGIFSLLCVVGMLISWRTGHRDAGRILTYLASTSYIAVAICAGAHRSAFGRLVLLGVVCCWIGDIVGPKNFLAGAGAFLLGHLFFIPAFILRGIDRKHLLIGFLVYAVVCGLALAWIGPQIPSSERIMIFSYTAIIGLMAATSVGTWRVDRKIALGAAIFFISDLFLAQTAFLDGGFIFTLFGYPLYYLAVLILAYSPMRYTHGSIPIPGEALPE